MLYDHEGNPIESEPRDDRMAKIGWTGKSQDVRLTNSDVDSYSTQHDRQWNEDHLWPRRGPQT